MVAIAWEEHDEDRWRLVLRCGGCEHLVEVIASDEQVDDYCLEFEQRLRQLMARAACLERERMAAEVEHFVAALRLDLISGDDFAR